MTKKRINEDAMVTELRGASVFFRPAEEEPHTEVVPEMSEEQANTPDDRPVDRTNVRTAVRSVKRIPKRYPFEFYQDQLEELKRLSLTEQIDGGKGNMSEMVREAVDDWLAKRKAQTQPA